VIAILRLTSECSADEESFFINRLKIWCKTRLANYQVPSEFAILNEIPKNVMGKVNKREMKDKVKNCTIKLIAA